MSALATSPQSAWLSRRARVGAAGCARVPATCGELVQGTVDGQPFLVSCPIDRWAEAAVVLLEGGAVVGPAWAPKSLAALRLALRELGGEGYGAVLRLRSPLPRGKGLGSSTADVGATIAAAAAALGRPLPPEALAGLAARVEPTDSSLLPGLACLDHRRGVPIEVLGEPPPLRLLVLGLPGTVDSVAFNHPNHLAARRAALMAHEPEAMAALAELRAAVRAGDPRRLAAAATRDARSYQRVLPTPHFAAVEALAAELGALGLCVAHSGTVAGLLFAPDFADLPAAAALARRRLPCLEFAWPARLASGGALCAQPAPARARSAAFLPSARPAETTSPPTRADETSHDR